MGEERIGSEVAGFRIVSVLGQGGMGTVYLAEQTSPRRKVVIKLLRPDLSRDEAFRQRFVHESEAAASTEHPNIVPIYAAGDADGVLYIAMRYVEGEDLRELIASRGPLPPDRAIEIVSQVAAALDAAHARGLVHRDVKPGNILLDEGGNAYLSDFGLIKRSEVETGLTKTGQFMGSIEYCAPEQIRGEEVDGRADVYSLACVLYEAIAGRPPFKRETEVATLYAHLEQPPPSLPPGAGSMDGLNDVLEQGMAKQPADRYPTAGAFARAARHALGVTSGERETVPPGSKRRRIAWIAGLVALVSLAAIVAIVAAADQDDDRPAVGAEPPGRPAAVKLDPETGAVEASIEGFSARSVPTFVGDLAAGEGGVWAGLPPLVHHLDPVTGTIRRSIPVPLPFAALAVGFRTVWVARPYIVERINPATDELLRPVRLEQPHGIVSASEIAVGTDAMWVATNDALYRIDPFTARVIASTDISGSTGLTVAYGTVWVVDDFSATLTAFDESNGKVRDSVGIPGSLDDVVAGSDSVWVLDHEAGVVSVVDPDSLSVLDTVRVGGDERDIVFGAGAVWLADGSDRSVTRIDPVNMQTAHFEVAGEALHVTVDRGTGDLWVLVVPEA